MTKEQKAMASVVGIGALLLFVAWTLKTNEVAGDSDAMDDNFVDPVLANGGMPSSPDWYWGANAGMAGAGDIYVNVDPGFLAFAGDELMPMFGYVGFAGYPSG